MDARAHGFDDLACEAVVVGVGAFLEVDGLQEDGEALDGLGAAGALGGGELEGVGDGGGEGAGCGRVRGVVFGGVAEAGGVLASRMG